MIGKAVKLLALVSLLTGAGESSACLQNPVQGALITSNFGMRFHPYYKIWREHRGSDFRAAMFTPIYASHGGQVMKAGWATGGGNAVFITDASGMQTRYLHMSRTLVEPGQAVQPGQKIGDSGNTGEASVAPHLHFEVNEGGSARDPRMYLCSRPPEKPDAGPETNDGSGGIPPSASSGKMAPSPLSNFGEDSESMLIAAMGEEFMMNPEWKRRVMTETDALPLWKMLAEMAGIKLAMKEKKRVVWERVQAIMAIRAARMVRQGDNDLMRQRVAVHH